MPHTTPAPADVLARIETLGPTGTPVTTPEVADGFDCTQRTVYNRLDALVDDGALATKKVGANGRVWWRPVGSDGRRPEPERRTGVRSHPVFDSEMVGVVVWNGDVTIEDANDAFLEMAGLTHEEALGTSWRELTPEEFYPHSRRHIEEVKTNDTGAPYEKQYYHADGSRWWGVFESRALTDDEVVEFVVDVTGRKRHEQALRENERRYRTVLNSMDEGFLLADVVFDDDGEPLDVFYRDSNPAAVEMAGEEFEERWLTEIDMGYEEHWYEVFGRVAATGEGERHELYAEPGGSWYDFYVFKPDGAGPRRVAVVFQDVTERTEAERTIRESEATLDAFVTATADVVYRMSPDWSEMYELDGKELVVDTEESRETWLDEYIPPDEKERVMAAVEEAIETTTTFDLEHQVVQADGSRGWVHARAVPVLDDDGEIVEWFGTSTDITERKRLERELREQTEKLDVAVENSPLVLFRQDTDLRYTWYRNRHEDFEDADVLGKRDDELLPPDAAEAVLAPKRRALETGDRVREEVTYDLPDEEKTYDLTVDPIRDDDGEITSVMCAALDVTERKATEERLARQAELDTFRVELADTLRPLSDPVEVQHEAARVLGERLGVDRAHYAEVLDDGRTNRIHADYYREDGRSVVGEHDFEDYGAYVGEAFRAGDTVVVEDTQTRSTLSDAARETHDRMDPTAWVGVPLHKDGDLSAYVAVTESEPRTWTDVEVAMVEATAERTWAAVERARAERVLREREAALDRLNDATRELIDADSGTLADRVAPLVRAVLDVEYAALWRYDERTGDLGAYAVDVAGDADADAVATADAVADRAWETFVGSDVVVENGDGRPDGPPANRAFAPLGRHGVVCLCSTRADAFDERTVDLVETVTATVEAAWDRAESEAELARQNEELTRLDRLNTLIRRIDQALVAADTREEIDEAVCDRLAESDLYEFAWIGDSNPGTDVVHPRAWAGVDGAYVEDLTVAADERSAGRDPVARAANTGDPQVVADVATDSSVAPWREATLERGARSLACIPLVYDGSLYGVLSVYADRPGAAARDHEVLSELGDTVAHAVGARETRATLGSNSTVELTLRIPDAETPLPRLARETGCTIDYQGFVRRADGDADVFFVTAADLAAVAERSVVVEDVEALADRAEGALFRARVADPTLAAWFTDAGAVVRSMAVDADATTVVLDLPHTAAVREFLDRVREWTPVELRARNLRERPLKTHQTFAAALGDRLTDRQREVLQTAYLSGYFETPRANTGGEVADLIGVSQPTFSEHLRSAEHALCAVLFEDDHGPGRET